jgi:hypothetical protein
MDGLSMAKDTYKVTLLTTPTRILKANPNRISYTVLNISTIDAVLGANDGMSYDQSEPFPPGTSISDDQDLDDVFGMASAGTVDVIVIDKLRSS